jgi:2-(1,2-epoxy-1,2-dihydrophenyl)acetyl-CoA isomerase
MDKYQSLLVTIDGPIATICFNRPDQLNAINGDIRREFVIAAQQVNHDPSIRVVMLTGQGRAFCAGADLTEAHPAGMNAQDVLNNEYKPALMAITDSTKPWISAVNGAAAGIGSAFAMACDLTIMAENAYLYQAFAAIGLIPDGGATWHLAHTVGRKKAYELIAFGEKLQAADCLQLGLCNKVVPAADLIQQANSMAQLLASKAPLSLRYAKQALNASISQNLPDTISHEAQLQEICINSQDAQEGAQAFLQKRAAVFTGK